VQPCRQQGTADRASLLWVVTRLVRNESDSSLRTHTRVPPAVFAQCQPCHAPLHRIPLMRQRNRGISCHQKVRASKQFYRIGKPDKASCLPDKLFIINTFRADAARFHSVACTARIGARIFWPKTGIVAPFLVQSVTYPGSRPYEKCAWLPTVFNRNRVIGVDNELGKGVSA
jgi:hypothetical protein